MNFLFRVDSSTDIGVGHVMRCLTLAVELREQGHKICFACKELSGNIIPWIRLNDFVVEVIAGNAQVSEDGRFFERVQMEDAESTRQLLKNFFYGFVDWLIVDHYSLDCQWHQQFYQKGLRLLVIDDLADRYFLCDLLLDQTLNRSASDYKNKVNSESRLLLGSEYVLLRKEFRSSNHQIKQLRFSQYSENRLRILVMLGGTDPKNLSLDIVKMLNEDKRDISITVVLGSSSTFKDAINNYISRSENIRLEVDCHRIAELMMEHDICIGAAGGSAWERCVMGLPTILLAFAENQKILLQQVVQSGAALSIRFPLEKDELIIVLSKIVKMEKYQSMVNACLKVCDGDGVKRVVNALTLNSKEINYA